MKTFIAALSFFVFGLCSTAHAASQQLGIYVGGKVGASIMQFNDRKFGMETGGGSAQGYTFSWDHQTLGMGDKHDAVFATGLLLGYDLDKRLGVPVRVELDYTFRDRASKENSRGGSWNFTTNGKPSVEDNTIGMKTAMQLQTLMFNAWFDIPTGTGFRPYLGGGIGFAFIDHSATGSENGGENISDSKSETNFAWSLGGGLGYGITQNLTADLGYRYINAGDSKVSFGQADDGYYSEVGRIEAHDILLALRYTF